LFRLPEFPAVHGRAAQARWGVGRSVLCDCISGSGLLFVGSLFASAAAAGALVETAPAVNIQQANNEIYYFARRVSYTFLNVFAIKMAGVFMFTTCTIVLRTAILPRWVAFSGFVFGVALLVVISNWLWIALLFPLWILLVSTQILVWDRMGHR
jgi:hypothetical protein